MPPPGGDVQYLGRTVSLFYGDVDDRGQPRDTTVPGIGATFEYSILGQVTRRIQLLNGEQTNGQRPATPTSRNDSRACQYDDTRHSTQSDGLASTLR